MAVLADVLIVLIIVVGVIGAIWLTRRGDSRRDDIRVLAKKLLAAKYLIDQIETRSREMANDGDPFARSVLLDIEDYHRKELA